MYLQQTDIQSFEAEERNSAIRMMKEHGLSIRQIGKINWNKLRGY